ncbi:MAG: hypothetical protein IJ433_04785 [Ruminococcus sp.]|nr:hypothetical protein [Ruminococcus sp.]
MKTFVKPLIFILALLLMSSMIFGITAIAAYDTPSEHAIWTSDDSKDSITYNGVEYKKLPVDYIAISNPRDMIYVTNSNTLEEFKSLFGLCMSASLDDNFITTSFYNDSNDYAKYNNGSLDNITNDESKIINITYCKADIYDDVMACTNKGLAFTDYYYEHCEDSPNSKNEFYFLSDKENDAINQVISTATPVKNSTIDLEKCNIATLKSTDDNHYFVGGEKLVIAQNADSKIYVMIYSEEKCAYTHYEVPETMYDIFANLLNH